MSCKSVPNTCCGGSCISKKGNCLLTWEDPKKSSIVLASIISSLLLIKYVNIPALLFRVSTYALLLSVVAEYSTKTLTGRGLVTSYYKPLEKNYVGDFLDYYSVHFVTIFKKFEIKTQKLFASANTCDTLKAVFASYFLYKLTSLFSLWTIAFYLTIISFTAPKVYQLNKELIDANVCKAVKITKEKVAEAQKVATDKCGPQLEKAKEVLSPVIKLVESKLPVRTAGTTVNESKTEFESQSKPSVATTSSSQVHETGAVPKKPVVQEEQEEQEVDFNKLGEELKKEAMEATQNSEVYSKEKIDTTSL